MRQFQVVVNISGKPTVYPPQDGGKATKLMSSLLKRGFKSKAYTETNGVEDILDLVDMEALF